MRSARISIVLMAALFATPVRAQVSQIEPLKTAAKTTPSDVSAAIALGRAYRRAGRYPEALAELRRGVSYARAGSALQELHFEIARTYIARGDFGAAMVQCKVLGALPGGAASGHACAAEAHLLWKRASEALTETALALKTEKSYDAKVAEGRAHELELKVREAEAAFREAIAWKPDRAEAHIALGRMLVGLGDADAGVRELREALRLDPTNPETAYELGAAIGANTEAVMLLSRAAKERLAYAPAERKLAEMELALGHVAEARAAAEAALKSDRTDASAHVLYGRVLLAEKKPDLAITQAESALKILANSGPAKLLVGDANAQKGEIDLALEAYQSAYGFDHTEPAPLVRASEACRAAGRFTSAKAFGMKAIQDFPTWAPGWVAYGDALLGDGEPAGAKTAYESALKAKGPLDAGAVQRKIAAIK